ncbi:Wadjet anti-phage system protein JetD domain-containing protein [Aquibacillus kalidii]|uniref:Wadjet anti-phage system protein JetD domain-containing protein n=1 Tax=Aquibacillus kalidii TaxID=2762597 RepID=UPI0016487C70|nr:Wadjet anti-phage system protein JetD domain-containing protein [Aquibacillus kalidii]
MDRIKRHLAAFKKKTITITELEKLIVLNTYEDFAEVVLQLESAGTLVMVKSKGRTTRVPSLAFQYRINKNDLSQNLHKQIQNYRITLHPLINLDYYYSQAPTVWEHDLIYLEKIDRYLRTEGLPTVQVPAPERSFEIVGNEKWITELGGKELLDRVGLFDKLAIIPVSEPLMFAVNPSNIREVTQYHLIVENKTTYQGLLPVLHATNFSTLIYGSGKTVIGSIDQFSMQFPVQADHNFYYFGDLDKEGISIWYSLHQKQQALLALPFYQACLQKEAVKGKEYQRERKEALDSFIAFFKSSDQKLISNLLENGNYYPQEILKTKELQRIWRESDWTS